MDLTRLFYPRSVAVVGASPKRVLGRFPFFQILGHTGFSGTAYPVNPSYTEVEGVRAYPSLDALPEPVDLAICSVPARLALETTEAAARRGVRFLHFFTSGFSEVGNQDLEDAMLRAARKGKTRIVGPNCLGVLCTESRVTFDPTILQETPGTVAFLGQSGGVTNNVTRTVASRRIGLNKAVSFGNQIDLAAEDYIAYFGEDPSVKVVGAYLEDIKDGRAFIDALRKCSRSKPVIVLKGGSTEQGARAAASHTGALAGRHAVWQAVMRQHRCIEVRSQKQLVDVIMLAVSDKIPRGPNMAYMGAGGGTSVLFADLAVRAGLALPELEPAVQAAIARHIPDVNTSTANPVDLGAHGFNPEVVINGLKAIDMQENLDGTILYLTLDHLSLFKTEEVEQGLGHIAASAAQCRLPVIPILPKAAEDQSRLEELRLLALGILREAGLPMYNSLQEAVAAVSSLLAWSMEGDRP